ncbi:antioxidant and copper/iron homeostasis protein [Scheffersomyces xylosifermentans]|uniref:antioxidant and copper/iron homeostasis protein n=1 Tax=Scheffersomyces xylosifermentans TaxID=1304137 RepID=UPI00315C6354
MSGHKYHFDVTMSCSGCSGAVNRVLTKLDGVSNIDISLEKQTVDVATVDSLDYDTVYNTIAKTGKKINSGKVVE